MVGYLNKHTLSYQVMININRISIPRTSFLFWRNCGSIYIFASLHRQKGWAGNAVKEKQEAHSLNTVVSSTKLLCLCTCHRNANFENGTHFLGGDCLHFCIFMLWFFTDVDICFLATTLDFSHVFFKIYFDKALLASHFQSIAPGSEALGIQ